MSQNVVNYSGNPKGPGLLDDYLAKDQENYRTSHSGIVRPSYAREGMIWVDKSVSPWLLKIYDGTDDIIIGKVDAGANTFVPSTPMTTKGDILVGETNGKPVRLGIGAVNYILTANGSGNLPSWSKNPIGVYIYESSRTYSLNELVVGNVNGVISIYKSLANNNVGNALSDTTKWVSILSDDANVVHRTGNETINDTKTFTGNVIFSNSGNFVGHCIRNTNYSYLTNPATAQTHYIVWGDKDNHHLSYIQQEVNTSGTVNLNFVASNYKTDGTRVKNFLNVAVHRDGTTSTSAPTPPTTSNSTQIATTAFFRNNMQVVSALPSSPVSGVFYFVKE